MIIDTTQFFFNHTRSAGSRDETFREFRFETKSGLTGVLTYCMSPIPSLTQLMEEVFDD